MKMFIYLLSHEKVLSEIDEDSFRIMMDYKPKPGDVETPYFIEAFKLVSTQM